MSEGMEGYETLTILCLPELARSSIRRKVCPAYVAMIFSSPHHVCYVCMDVCRGLERMWTNSEKKHPPQTVVCVKTVMPFIPLHRSRTVPWKIEMIFVQENQFAYYLFMRFLPPKSFLGPVSPCPLFFSKTDFSFEKVQKCLHCNMLQH